MNNNILVSLSTILVCGGAAIAQPARPLVPIAAPVNKCDFCLASQGISPLEAGASGARLDARYLRLGTIYGEEGEHDSAGGHSHGEDEVETHFTQQYSLFYMISPSLTLNAIVPVPHRHATMSDLDGTPISGDQFGLGDISLLGRYRLLTEHDFETTTILSLSGGVKLPTGRTDGTDSRGHLLDAHMQLGTGSTDILLGAGGFVARDRWALAANLLASLPSEGANDHRFGNSMNYDATLRYRVYPEDVDVRGLFLGLGIYGELRGRETEEGEVVDDSGGNVVYLGPTVQVNLSERFSLEGSYHYPILHRLYGRQLGEDYRIAGGAMFLF